MTTLSRASAMRAPPSTSGRTGPQGALDRPTVFPARVAFTNDRMSSNHGREIIHSGHFMISSVPQDEDEDEEGDGGGVDPLDAEAEEEDSENQMALARRLQQQADTRSVKAPAAPSAAAVSPSTNPLVKRPAHAAPARSGRVEAKASGPRARSNSVSQEVLGNRSRMSIEPQPKGTLIDSSLSKLFQCMTLAYRAKLTSPKWNNFKGLKLRWTIKIRLNNVIWRAWHMQFIKQVRPLIAPFSIEVDNTVHNKTEGGVLVEGKYWKRRQSIVSSEYGRWRRWYKDRLAGPSAQNDSQGPCAMNCDPYMETSGRGGMMLQQPYYEEPMMLDDFLMPDFTDALLASLGSQPFAFPNPREIAQAGNADFIQPGLLPLQPSLEDLMDTLEPLNEYFAQQNQAASGYAQQAYAMSNSQDYGQQQQDNYGISDSYWTQSMSDYPGVQSVSPPAPAMPPPSRVSGASGNSFMSQPEYSSGPYQQTTAYSTPYGGGTLDPMPMDAFRSSQPEETMSDAELRRQEMRVRSQSGPTPGAGPLIRPEVLAALANFNRSISASSGNVTQTGFAANDAQAGSASAPVSRLNSIVPTQTTFAVPEVQPVPKGRGRGKKAATPASPNQRFASTSTSPQMVTMPASNEGSTLAQLLTSGPAFPKSVIQPTGSPNKKKLAPKPVGNEMKIRPATVTPVPVSPTPVISEAFVIPKIETSFQDSGAFRQRLDEPMGERPRSRESRRQNHITAEQKRRGHIKSGFEILQGLVPNLAHNPGQKVSKAVILHRGAEHIHQLKEERRAMQTEADALKQQIEAMNQAVIVCQQQLPATGAPVSSRARKDRMNEMLDEHIRAQTMHNWKYWLFSLIMRPLFDSYASSVGCRGVEDMSLNVANWVDQQCTLAQLRPMIKESMRKVSTSTHILSDPTRVPEEARQAAQSAVTSSGSRSFASPAGSASSSTASMNSPTSSLSPPPRSSGAHFS